MADIKITDLVDPEEIRKLKELDAELRTVLDTYTQVAKDLAQGLKVDVKVAGDIDKLENLLNVRGKEAVDAQKKLTDVMQEQSQVIANTTNTISRQIMEQERVNKTTRATYTEQERVKKLLDQYHDTYENQIDSLIRINRQLEENKKKQKDNEQALKMGRMSASDFAKSQAELMASTRDLTQQKRTLNQIMTAEEKANQAVEGSYAQLSQQLELLKKAYKEMGDESKASDFGKEMEETIQNLDAHLKDMAADMGEFQRNVGNYAIANGGLKKHYDELVVTLASLQSQYAKLSEEEKSGAEGKKLAASIEEVSKAAKETKRSLDEQNNALEDARRSLGETGGKTTSVKRDLKELVLEIANLTIEYDKLSKEEQQSAEGKALADHIRDLTEQAGVLKDAIADTNQAIVNAASDTRGFDQLAGALQLAIDGFGLATGGAEMLGISSEDLEKIQTKLQAAIAASNAMQSMQNTLQKQSAVMQGVNILKTKAAAVAENLKTAAQGRGVIATKAATVAQAAFNAVANANPYILLATGIAALVGAFMLFSSKAEKATEDTEEFHKAVADAASEPIAKVEELSIQWTRLGNSMEAKRAFIKEHQEDFKNLGVAIESVSDAENLLIANKDAFIRAQIEKAKAHAYVQAAQDKIKESLEKQIALEAQVAKMEREGDTNGLDFYRKLIEDQKKATDDIIAVIDKNFEKAADAEERGAALLKEANIKGIDEVSLAQKEFLEYISTGSSGLEQGFKSLGDTVAKYYNSLVDSLLDSSSKLLNRVGGLLNSLGNAASGLWGKFVGFFSFGDGTIGSRVSSLTSKIASEEKKLASMRAKNSKASLEDIKKQEDAVQSLKSTYQTLTGESFGGGGSKAKSTLKARSSSSSVDDLKKQVEAGEDALLNLTKDSLERQKEQERLSYERRLKELQDHLAKVKDTSSKMYEAINNQIIGLNAAHAAKVDEMEIEAQSRQQGIQADFYNYRLKTVEEGSKEEYDLRKKMLANTYAAELTALKRRLNAGEVSQKEYTEYLILAQLAHNKEEEKLAEEHAVKMNEIIQNRYSKEQKDRENGLIEATNALKRRYAGELLLAKGNVAKQEELKKQLDKDMADLQTKYAQETAQASIDLLEETLKTEGLSAEDRKRIEQELANAKIHLEQLVTDARKDAAEEAVKTDNEAAKKRKDNLQGWLEKAAEACNAITGLMNAVYEGQIKKIEELQDANTEAGEAEQERIAQMVEQNVITEEEGEARKRAAEELTSKKNEELEKKKQKLQYKQAIWDKANSIAQVGISTALAIMNMMKSAPWPTNIAMAAVAGAMGAVQLATIIATPIPKYAKGTESHKGGPAIVGDGGVPEVITYGGNAWITPDKPTLVDLPAGAAVIPDVSNLDESELIVARPLMQGGKDAPKPYNDAKVIDRLDNLIFIKQRESRARRLSDIDSQLASYLISKSV